MSRRAFASVLAALGMTVFVLATGAAGQEQKHSGVIVEVGPGPRTITVEEMGLWTGPDSRPQRQIIRLTSQTRIERVSRSDSAPAAGDWPGGFTASQLNAAELRPGDFATVTATPSGGELIAESIAVVQPPRGPLPPGEPRPRAANRAR